MRRALALVALLASFAFADEDRLRDAELALGRGDYSKAIDLLKSTAKDAKDAKDYILYLIGVAELSAGKPEEAIASFDKLLSDFKDSAYRTKATCRRADALAAKGDFAAAEKVYEDQVALIRAEDRRNALALIYVSAAREFLTPKKEGEQPDYAKSLDLLVKAQEIGALAKETERVAYEVPFCQHKLGQHDAAVAGFEKLLKDAPKGDYADDALFHRGLSPAQLGRTLEAREAWDKVVSDFPKSDWAADALMEIGKSHATGANTEDLVRAVAAYRRVVADYPKDDLAPQALGAIARTYLSVAGMTTEAYAAVEELIKSYPQSAAAAEALHAKAADLLGERKYDEAIAEFGRFLELFPQSPLFRQVSQEVVDARHAKAYQAYLDKRYDDARKLFETFLATCPLDPRGPQLGYLLGEMAHEEKKFDDAIAAWKRVVEKYTGTDEAAHAQLSIAETLANDQARFDEALKEYAKVLAGQWQGIAQQRIQQLEGKSLALVTERAIPTGAKAVVKLKTRNVEKAKFKVYRVDLRDYFLKTVRGTGWDALDIALIAPDKEWDVAVAGYAKHKEFTQDVELPFSDTGAYIVTATEETLEAKTLVLVSDLGVVLKATQRGAAYYLEDLKTTTAVKEASSFLVGADGRLMTDPVHFPDDRQTQALSVFVEAMGQFVAVETSLAQVPKAEKPRARGVLLVDRPTYRPGERVNLWAALRDADDGKLALPGKEKKAVLEATLADGRRYWKQEVASGAFGTWGGSFGLDEALPTCAITVTLKWKDQVLATAAFRVGDFPDEAWTLDFGDAPKSVKAGEKVELTLTLRDAEGRPAPGRKVDYGVNHVDMGKSAVTDERGEVKLSLDTNRYYWQDFLYVEATVAGASRPFTRLVKVIDPGYRVEFVDLRGTYVSEEPVAVRVKTRGFDDQARGAKLAWRAVRVSDAGEKEVGKGEVTTDEKTGEGTVSFQAAAGGAYRLELEGRDARGVPIVVTGALAVSEPKDEEPKLHAWAAETRVKAGQPVAVTLHWRGEKALAFVTVEATEVVATKVVELAKGKNEVKLDLGGRYVPVFCVTTAVLAENKTYQDLVAFTMTRELTVKVSTEAETVRPGDSVTATIHVTDAEGKPVAANVLVVAYDAADEAFFGGIGKTTDETFFPRDGNAYVATVSSVPFHYEGGGQARDEQVLQALAVMEAESRLRNAPVNMERPQVETTYGLVDSEGIGGGGGGQSRYGGRFGGKRNLVARGGGSRDQWVPYETPPAFCPSPVFWNANVKTGKNGEATVTIAAPTRIASLKILAIAFAKDTSTGRGDATLRVTQPVQLTLESPRMLREGDKGSALVIFRGEGTEAHDVEVHFTVHQGGEDKTLVEKMKFAGTIEKTFEIPATSPGPGWVQVSIDKQSVRMPLTIEPWATPTEHVDSASASGRTTVAVDVPKDASAPALDILVSRGDVEMLRFLDEASFADDGVMTHVARLAARVDARALMTHPKNTTKYAWKVDAEIADLARRLMLLQNPDGGWPWQQAATRASCAPMQPQGQQMNRNNEKGDCLPYVEAPPSDPFVTAFAFHVLSRVEKAWQSQLAGGNKDMTPVLDRATAWIKRTFSDTEENDLKAICLAALSARSDAQIFAYANRLYRGKETLGPRALVLTAITFQQIGKAAEAREMLALFAKKGIEKDGLVHWEAEPDANGGLQSPVELTALGVEAMALLTPDDARLAPAWRWVLSQRAGQGWRTAAETFLCADTATAIATGAADFAAPETVTVLVNGKAISTVGAADGVAWGRVRVPASALRTGANEVVLEPKGAGRFAYAARLSYGAPGVAATPGEVPYEVKKSYHFPAMRDAGEEVSSGYSVVRGSFTEIENPLDRIAAQEPFTVTLDARVKDKKLRYLVVEDAIPAGCVVVPGSVSGDFASFAIERGRIVFRIVRAEDQEWHELSYRLYPLHAGSYRVPPVAAGTPWGASAARLAAREKTFDVLAAGADFRDGYARTPDELYGLGSRLHARKEYDKALAPLTELLSKWKLQDGVYTTVSRLLVSIYLEKKDSENVVRFFEVMKEKDPSTVIAFDDIVRIGAAYREMKEHERGMQVFRGTADAYFLQEANLSGSLEAMGKTRSSVDFMRKLALSYPDTDTIRSTVYGLGGDLFRRAKAMEEGPAPADKEKFSRAELLAESIAWLRGTLRENPAAKNIDEVVFTLGNAYLEQEAYETAEAWSRLSFERFKESRFHHSFEYMVAYALFAVKKYDEALAMCGTIIAANNPGPSEYAPQARHMMGQIFHAMGQVDKALASYREVKASFPDAARAIEYLEKQALSLPEVTSVALKEKHEVELESRGVAEVTMKAYKVDLMMLYLKQRNLNDVTKVNLAGVKPVWEKTVKLENGSHFKKVETKIAVDVKGPGAFLIIARAGDISASGMLISSDLTLDVQVDLTGNVVRTNAISRVDGKFEENAKVSGIGSRDSGFFHARTDLRGVAELEGLHGFPTVIVEKDGHYGFFRGRTDLGMAEAAAQQEQYQEKLQRLGKQLDNKKAALEELEKNLKGVNDEQNALWNENSNRAQKGCEVERTK